jgi:hypothetical protein
VGFKNDCKVGLLETAHGQYSKFTLIPVLGSDNSGKLHDKACRYWGPFLVHPRIMKNCSIRRALLQHLLLVMGTRYRAPYQH